MMHPYIERGKLLPKNADMHSKGDTRAIIRTLMQRERIESERDLAIRAGIDQSSFNRYMREETTYLSLRTLQAIAETFSVTSSQLLGEVPLEADPKTAEVVRVMERLPDNLKDVLVATSKSLASSNPPKH